MHACTSPVLNSLDDLLVYEAELDRATCGISLAHPEETRFRDKGAHDSTPTYYFVLEALFTHLPLDARTHLLDVGCGTGRVLAQFLRGGCAGKATGIELDPELAQIARSWTGRHSNLEVLQGNVLDLDLSPFTCFYLFNPFDADILEQFIQKVELEVAVPCAVIHMSDNGDTWHYRGRPGWTELASGRISGFVNARGRTVETYDCPQHYSVWRFERDG